MRLSEDLRQPTKRYASEAIEHQLRETDELMAIFTTMVAKLRKSGA